MQQHARQGPSVRDMGQAVRCRDIIFSARHTSWCHDMVGRLGVVISHEGMRTQRATIRSHVRKQCTTTRRHVHAQRATTRCKERKHCAHDPFAAVNCHDPSAAVNCDVHCLGHCSKKKFDPRDLGLHICG